MQKPPVKVDCVTSWWWFTTLVVRPQSTHNF